MLIPLYAILAVAALFYVVIPAASAVGIALGWRRFRRRVVEAVALPSLGYGEIAAAMDEPRAGAPRAYKLYGKIEAMEGNHRIWVRGEQASALVDLSGSPLYVLGPGKPTAGAVGRFSWKSVSSLASGTSILVAGKLSIERGKPVFVDTQEERLIAVTYDGGDADLLRRLVVGGRRINEYWTGFGPLSLAVGMTVSSGLLVLLGGHTAFSTVRALAFLAAVSPVLVLLPPGLIFFLAYRQLWRRALNHRILRDVLVLPVSADEPPRDRDGAEARIRREQQKATILMLLAILSCGFGVLLNYVLVFLLWRSLR